MMSQMNRPVRKLVLQFVLLVFLGCAFDLIVSGYTLFLSNRNMPMAVLFSTLTPFFSFIAQHWFVEEPTIWRRVVLTFGTAIGYGLGTWISLLLFGGL